MTGAELDSRLAELIVGYNVLTSAALDRARSFQAGRQSTLAGALRELHLVPPETLAPLLEELTGVRAVDPSLMTVYPDFVEKMNQLVPPEVVARLLVFPAQADLNAVHVCMLNPTDGWTIRALESMSGCRIVPFVAHEAALTAAITEHYGRFLNGQTVALASDGKSVVESAYRAMLARGFDEYLKPAIGLMNRSRDAVLRDAHALESIIRDPLVIRLVQQILARAVEAGASDIHIEPTGDALRVRVRVDGGMRVAHTLPPNATVPIVARLKAMADLPIAASTAPQDARIGYDIVWGRGIDLRFSLVPAITGEKIVLRVLDRSRERRELADLGMDPESQAAIEAAAELPNGLLLVTGPTGSGKSSTLYALLDRLNDEDTCVLTAEDPVESRIAGVTQVHCDEASGVTFATALRSFLRQDPDVLMVGEIRDAETADIALKAALTGHLVLSTLHTNDSPGAVLRLINMNLEPFLIASALRLVVAQRLLRRLCVKCRRKVDQTTHTMVNALPASARALLANATIYEAAGCPACGGSGYRGRTGIFEVLRVTEGIEDLIIRRASVPALRAQARAEGMRTLREAGLRKVALGETSIAEVLEQTVADAEDVPAPPSPSPLSPGAAHHA
ncbi:MAG: GspE/PulE family protein [Vicinamibacterales bacterium]